MWKNHVQPAFGDKEIESFKITDLNDFLYDLYGKQGKSYPLKSRVSSKKTKEGTA